MEAIPYSHMKSATEMLVLYDGVCLFCEGWVNFVIDRMTERHRIQFIPLQSVELSPEVQSRLDRMTGGDSIVCISADDHIYLKSDATLMIMKQLDFPYNRLAGALHLIPAILRNPVYDFIGKRRYRIWGRKNVCVLPDGERRKYFVAVENDLSGELKAKHEKYFLFKSAVK